MEDKEFYIPCDDCEYYIEKCCSCPNDTEKPCKHNFSGANIGLGTLYDMNKQILKQMPTLSDKRAEEEIANLALNLAPTKYQYFMLLNNEKKDYTLFNFHNERPSTPNFRKDFFECLVNRGDILSIEAKAFDSYEIWLKDDSEEVFCYYFFPYDLGVLEY